MRMHRPKALLWMYGGWLSKRSATPMRVRMTEALPVAVFAPAIQRYNRDKACKCWNWCVSRTPKWTIGMGIRTIHSTFTTLREKRNFTLNAFRHAGIALNAWFALLAQT